MTATINHKLIKADRNQCSFCSVRHYISPCRSHSLLSVNGSQKNQTKNNNHVVTLQHGGPFRLSAPHSPLQLLHTNWLAGVAAGNASTIAASFLFINTLQWYSGSLWACLLNLYVQYLLEYVYSVTAQQVNCTRSV